MVTPEYTWTEIAREMNITEATVRCYFNRGAKKFKRNRLRMLILNHKPFDCEDEYQKIGKYKNSQQT